MAVFESETAIYAAEWLAAGLTAAGSMLPIEYRLEQP